MKDESIKASAALERMCGEMLLAIGEDTQREGLLKTPNRFARAFAELTSGYKQTPREIVGDAIFNEPSAQMVVVKKIEFFSLCEHHLLPFFGFAHVAYIPNGRIVGLSKIPRLVNLFARRLQVQERMTNQICDALQDELKPHGVACMLDASHMCMMMRGIQVQSSSTVTTAMRGIFLENLATRDEFLHTIRMGER